MDADNMSDPGRSKVVCSIADNLYQAMSVQKSISKELPFHQYAGSIQKLGGVYILMLYLCLKIAFITNAVCQFFILNAFLSTHYAWWGYGVLQDILNGREWEESGHFPRVTMCDFDVKVLGNLQRHSLQCVLMINMFNEKVYLFIWWWMLLVAVLNVASFLRWLYFAVVPSSRRAVVNKCLRIGIETRKVAMRESSTKKRFISFLSPDGMFVLKLIAMNASYLVAYEITQELWSRVTRHPRILGQNGIRRPSPKVIGENAILLHGNPLAVVLEANDSASNVSAENENENKYD